MGFVIDNLGPSDRLCVVSFSTDATRMTRLLRMSDAGKATAKRAVESLAAGGWTNIATGLRVAARVLGDRRHVNAVSSVILLSDGQDTYSYGRHVDLVPRSHTSAAPIHTFGFGADHDAAAMNTIAEATRGTFSFVENQAVIQDCFAQCIGGLLSVAVQDARVDVACSRQGVRVMGIKSGRYESHVDADGRAASVNAGELYADEERRFLLFLHVPAAESTEDVTNLISLSCTYRDMVTGRTITVAGGEDDAVIRRPLEVSAVDEEVSMKVERERVRVEATEDIAAARAAADRGDHGEASRTLRRRRNRVLESAPGRSGDATCEALELELGELEAAVADAPRYEQSGRASLLAGMSSHGLQRASGTRRKCSWSTSEKDRFINESVSGRDRDRDREREREREMLYATPAMERMVSKSRNTQQQKRSWRRPAAEEEGRP
uniref:VWFA domain-containing protein n=1 Tax=Leersia perrieri TaxID=77586 RepID=A0A0D9XKD9_9ORYZ